jgi:hypothetical protein
MLPMGSPRDHRTICSNDNAKVSADLAVALQRGV